MAVSFPSNPTIGEIFTYQGISWEWNGTFWQTYTFPSSGLTGSTSVGVGDSLISGIVDNVLELKSLSGDGITITDDGDTILLVSDSSGNYLPLSGGTVTGVTTFNEIVYVNNDFYVDSVYATNYYGLPSFPNTYVTGFSLSNDVITLTQNSNDVYSSFTISLSAYTGNTSGEYLPISGGTVTGGTNFTSGLTANTISATTYQNLPVSGITEGTNIGVTSANGNFTISFTGTVGSDFTGGTVTGATNFTSGLTANTISATNYNNLPVSGITGGSNIGINNTNGNVTISFTGTPVRGTFTGGTVSGETNFTNGLTANTISATTYNNLPVSGITNGTGITSTTNNGVVTITNTAPNQVITISGGTGITTGGTYPNFTITNSAPNQVVTISGGTGITTGGTYPNFTITNSAPDQTVVINNGYLTESSGTYPTFAVNYVGPTLLASGSVYIIPDGSYYGGSANDGWAGHYWDDYQTTIPSNSAWYGIPIPIEFRRNHYIKVCGVAFTDSSTPGGETFDVDINYYECSDFRTTSIGHDGFVFDKDGISCFSLVAENTLVNLTQDTSFIYLAFMSSNNAMDATITKITYNLSICSVSF